MNHRSRFLPVKPKNKVNKPYTSLSSVYEKVVPVAVKQPSQITPEVVPDYINDFTKPVKEKSVKKGPVELSEARTLFGKLLPHQKRMMLEEMALHEHSASSLNSDSVHYQNRVVDGSFESGTFSNWVTGGTNQSLFQYSIESGDAQEGSYYARIVKNGGAPGAGSISQAVTIPLNATLSFYYSGTAGSNTRTVSFGGVTLPITLPGVSVWTNATVSLSAYAGMTDILKFTVSFNFPYTSTNFDNITVNGVAVF